MMEMSIFNFWFAALNFFDIEFFSINKNVKRSLKVIRNADSTLMECNLRLKLYHKF